MLRQGVTPLSVLTHLDKDHHNSRAATALARSAQDETYQAYQSLRVSGKPLFPWSGFARSVW